MTSVKASIFICRQTNLTQQLITQSEMLSQNKNRPVELVKNKNILGIQVDMKIPEPPSYIKSTHQKSIIPSLRFFHQSAAKQNQKEIGKKERRYGLGVLSQKSRKIWGNDLDGQEWVEEQIKRNKFTQLYQSTINLEQLADKQVEYVKEDTAEAKLEKLKSEGKIFQDLNFQPTYNTLMGEYSQADDREFKRFRYISWVKMTEFLKNPVIFEGRPDPKDIRQGMLGDCYFLAGLSALAEKPSRIFKLFNLVKVNEQNYYSVRILYKGKWVSIDLDDQATLWNQGLCFAASKNDEIWVILLEKAWAKLYTSYARIVDGYPDEALHDLTGAPCFLYSTKLDTVNLWFRLLRSSQMQHPMVAITGGTPDGISPYGITYLHAYTLLNVVEVQTKKGRQKLVQVRDPTQSEFYSGDWNDYSKLWDQVTPQEKKRIGYVRDITDGIFFMPWQLFLQEFSHVYVTEVDDNASYVYLSIKDKQDNGGYFAVDIVKTGSYSFQVDKTPIRSYPRDLQPKTLPLYPKAQIQIGFINEGVFEKLSGIKDDDQRTTILKANLKPGRYIVFAKIYYNSKLEKDFDLNLAVYSQTVCKISLATREEAQLMAGKKDVNWTGQEEIDSNEETG